MLPGAVAGIASARAMFFMQRCMARRISTCTTIEASGASQRLLSVNSFTQSTREPNSWPVKVQAASPRLTSHAIGGRKPVSV